VWYPFVEKLRLSLWNGFGAAGGIPKASMLSDFGNNLEELGIPSDGFCMFCAMFGEM